MGTRIQLQTLLESILGSDKVYFQPPETVKLTYPCIIYSRSFVDTEFANDKPYKLKNRYTIIVVDKNPDSNIPEKIALLPSCRFERHYTKDNLNHDIYNIYY
jgi:hypothetical protein